MSGINDKAFKEAKRKLSSEMYGNLSVIVDAISERVANRIRHDGRYHNVTGNTRGSIAFGIFYDGNLKIVDTPYAREYIKRRTLIKGERYKGFKAPTGENHYYGDEESVKFLKSFTPSVKNGFDIVFVVGTEYAEYVEKVRQLNVMTDTFQFCQVTRDGLITGSVFPSSLDFDLS
ncbi:MULTISPECIES: hypothetical protein [Butyricimonas]|uniref:hypothetical protein n=1 Tax=Butyricimonas TaxID=574697 RepID=UPI0007FB2332|nr:MULTISPECIES: hypothetical protein [Butyricimonas]